MASANLQRLKWDLIGAENRVEVEVKDVLSALDAAQKRVTLSRQQHQTAKLFKEG